MPLRPRPNPGVYPLKTKAPPPFLPRIVTLPPDARHFDTDIQGHPPLEAAQRHSLSTAWRWIAPDCHRMDFAQQDSPVFPRFPAFFPLQSLRLSVSTQSVVTIIGTGVD